MKTKQEKLWLNTEQSKELYKIAFNTKLYQKKLAERRRQLVSEGKQVLKSHKRYCKHCGEDVSGSLCTKCSSRIHKWARKNIPKSNSCQRCGITNQPLDLSNNSQYYYQDVTDWEYLCRSLI